MTEQEKNKLFQLIENLAASSVALNLAAPEEMAAFVAQLEHIRGVSLNYDFKAGDQTIKLLLDLISSQGPANPDLLQEAIFCWISIMQSEFGSANPFSDEKKFIDDITRKLTDITADKAKVEGLQAAASPGAASDFVPRPPQLDLSEGTDLLLEFITESFDHLESAEEALMALENSPANADEINKIFRAFHTIKGVSSFLNLTDIRVLSHETETMMDLIRQGALSLDKQIAGAVFSSVDFLRKLLELLKEQVSNSGILKTPYFDISPAIKNLKSIIVAKTPPPSDDVPRKKLGSILLENDIVSESDLTFALEEQQNIPQERKIGEILIEMGAATKGQIERSLSEQKSMMAAGGVVKIAVKKLDDLLDAMGELVITGTQVICHPEISGSQDTRLVKDVGQLDRIIRDIQNMSMAIRLMPIRPVFQKMMRLIRDLSVKAGKMIEVKATGEDTEIDKNIIELVNDPLMHMIRNAIDHGIEPPESRRAKGKSETGIINLNAYHKGGNIVIEISDDGEGLNKQKITEKAYERGLARKDEALSDDKIYHFIFEPGFSTAEKVTDISGRGVGMDVVKRNIEQLSGRIEIESESGKGTKFTVRLPLTLAIIEGIVVHVGSERYIMPIFAVAEFIRPCVKDITTITGKGELIKIHGNLFPVVWLSNYFSVQYKNTDIENTIGCLVNSDDGQFCILIDELVGQQQIVIKNLGAYLREAKTLSGATILGDGRVGLILDINAIAALACNRG